jgi:hypothetical protein
MFISTSGPSFYTPFGVTWFGTWCDHAEIPSDLAGFYTPFGVTWFGTSESIVDNKGVHVSIRRLA